MRYPELLVLAAVVACVVTLDQADSRCSLTDRDAARRGAQKMLDLAGGGGMTGLDGKRRMHSGEPSRRLEEALHWYDGDRRRPVWLDPELLAEFGPGSTDRPTTEPLVVGARLACGRRGVRIWRLDGSETGLEAAQRLEVQGGPGRVCSPMLHDAPGTGSPARALPGGVLVRFDPAWDLLAIQAWAAQRGLRGLRRLAFGRNRYAFDTEPGLASLRLANEIHESGEVVSATPNWWLGFRMREAGRLR